MLQLGDWALRHIRECGYETHGVGEWPEFVGAEWCLEAIERELAHDMYDDDQAKEWWWDARRPLYVRLYRAAALQGCGTYISVPACWQDEQGTCEREGLEALEEAMDAAMDAEEAMALADAAAATAAASGSASSTAASTPVAQHKMSMHAEADSSVADTPLSSSSSRGCGSDGGSGDAIGGGGCGSGAGVGSGLDDGAPLREGAAAEGASLDVGSAPSRKLSSAPGGLDGLAKMARGTAPSDDVEAELGGCSAPLRTQAPIPGGFDGSAEMALCALPGAAEVSGPWDFDWHTHCHGAAAGADAEADGGAAASDTSGGGSLWIVRHRRQRQRC